ncbi:MAG TPA: GspH/FimT family pseudopilin [Sedimentisphaerales bacterium]|nr:GspH/FimT family pseudopilin [Sedimentisphaerales bacterium]
MEINSKDNLVPSMGLCGRASKDVKPNGFTLIEMIVVIVILSIAAAMVVPMMSSADDVQLRSGANKLAADLEYAKSMAISRGQQYTVVFDEAAESYQIEDSSGAIIDHPIRKGSAYKEQFGGTSGLKKVGISDADFNDTDMVTFDSIGSPDNGGTVTLIAGGRTINVNVEAVTGYISISN